MISPQRYQPDQRENTEPELELTRHRGLTVTHSLAGGALGLAIIEASGGVIDKWKHVIIIVWVGKCVVNFRNTHALSPALDGDSFS